MHAHAMCLCTHVHAHVHEHAHVHMRLNRLHFVPDELRGGGQRRDAKRKRSTPHAADTLDADDGSSGCLEGSAVCLICLEAFSSEPRDEGRFSWEIVGDQPLYQRVSSDSSSLMTDSSALINESLSLIMWVIGADDAGRSSIAPPAVR